MLYDALIRGLDNWYCSIENKAFFINQTKTVWSDLLLLQDKKLEWLTTAEGPTAKWAWEHIQGALRKNNQHYLISSYNPTNTEEFLSCIHSVFDCWPGHPSELREIHSKMKRALAQQKYRDSLDAKKQSQSTFVLSNDSKKHLSVMAKAYNVNQNQMLESIINKEYEEYKGSRKSSKK